MRHFPIFLDTTDQLIVVVGGGDTAVSKLRLLLKTEATVVVVSASPCALVEEWAASGRIELRARELIRADLGGARLVYAATDDPRHDARIVEMARDAGALANSVDNLESSDFITPAIVDRDPVIVAIGTEGTAPVLARAIKADIEGKLPTGLGALARRAAGFRRKAENLPAGRVRRGFWTRFFFDVGPRALADAASHDDLDALYDQILSSDEQAGRVSFVGAGPGDPDLLTRKAHRILHDADVVIHDRLVSSGVLELARREAIVVSVGKQGFGPSWDQDDINAEIIRHAQNGHHVVRLKGGDPGVFGRLEEEIAALDQAGVAYDVVPGITAAHAAAASVGRSLTSRGRNSGFRTLTAHDLRGFAEQDWRALAAPGEVAAIYMGKRAAKYVSGRLMMFGIDPDTSVTAVENASLPTERRIATCISRLGDDLAHANCTGPVVILLGIAATRETRINAATAKVMG